MKQITAKDMLGNFCKLCWSGTLDPKGYFLDLRTLLRQCDIEQKKDIIPQLVEVSIIYPRLVFLANELLSMLPAEEQKTVKIPLISWTVDNTETQITEEEYLYRKINFGSCRMKNGKYYRPKKPEIDLQCFYDVVQMMIKSGQ